MSEGMNLRLVDGLRRIRRKPLWLVVGGVLLVGAVLAAVNHRVHLAQAVPYLLLLACPLMHLVMHRGHAGHGRRPNGDESASDDECHKPPA